MVDYVNRGPDPRIGGPVGWLLAAVQTLLSFHSTTPPKVAMLSLRHGGHLAICWPLFLSIFVWRGDGRWWSFRVGWRWDVNWPGYIADVIVKPDIDNVVQP